MANQDLLPIILERGRLLSPRQVAAVRGAQRQARAKGLTVAFGALVLEGELVDEEALARAVALQKKLAAPPGEPKRLGTYLLEAKALEPETLLEVLEAQAALGDRAPLLGELLLTAKLISRAKLEKALAAQAEAREA